MNRIALSVAALAFAGIAAAQYSSEKLDPTPYGFTLRGGIGMPIDRDLKDVSKTWLTLGAEFNFNKSWIRDWETTISGDWFGKSGNGEKGNFFPLMINQRIYLGEGSPDGGQRAYLTLGAGIVIFDLPESRTDTVFGGRAGLGFELSRSIVFEANGFFSDKIDRSTRGSIFQFAFGYRF